MAIRQYGSKAPPNPGPEPDGGPGDPAWDTWKAAKKARKQWYADYGKFEQTALEEGDTPSETSTSRLNMIKAYGYNVGGGANIDPLGNRIWDPRNGGSWRAMTPDELSDWNRVRAFGEDPSKAGWSNAWGGHGLGSMRYDYLQKRLGGNEGNNWNNYSNPMSIDPATGRYYTSHGEGQGATWYDKFGRPMDSNDPVPSETSGGPGTSGPGAMTSYNQPPWMANSGQGMMGWPNMTSGSQDWGSWGPQMTHGPNDPFSYNPNTKTKTPINATPGGWGSYGMPSNSYGGWGGYGGWGW